MCVSISACMVAWTCIVDQKQSERINECRRSIHPSTLLSYYKKEICNRMASSALLMAHCMTMQQEVELSDRRLPPASCLPDGWIRSSAIYAGTVHPFFPSSSAPPGLYPAAFIMHGPGPSLLFNLGPVYIRPVNKKKVISNILTHT